MKKKKGGSGGANWMDTYGDMVTLLLCFFVMLYSMSNMDKNKWIALVASLNPSQNIEEVVNQEQGGGVTQTEIDQNMDELYQTLSQYIAESGLSDKASLTRGSGYVFVSFDDTVFFDGDSYVLREDGKKVLDQIALPLSEAGESINEIRVLGHTAQMVPDRPNNVEADRFLASNRATMVTIYLQEKNIIDPARLVSVGYGQWRPVAENDTSADREKNRRVELVVSGLQLDGEYGDSITQYYTMRSEQANE
ncbi:OmpA/MotB family protein [Angelakisella massiliensis]|uniref:OmpA/MotB family protein n=1 Tax=Angelakisella massiliensis TaxID=1871018 RepID=UPI0008F8413E|nr:flagellar motor protein MotB [Angelakisella massiliensis]